LGQFYLLVSQGFHKVDDRDQHKVLHRSDKNDILDPKERHSHVISKQLETAEEWLRLIAEEHTRAEVMRAGTGLLVAHKIVQGLPVEMQSLLAKDDTYLRPIDGLAAGIRKRIQIIGAKYGIEVDRVSLQDLEFSEDIHNAAVNAAVSAYTPLIAQRVATAKKLDLEADAYGRQQMLEVEAKVIHPEALAKREVLGSAKPFAFGGQFGGIASLRNGLASLTRYLRCEAFRRLSSNRTLSRAVCRLLLKKVRSTATMFGSKSSISRTTTLLARCSVCCGDSPLAMTFTAW
jgi:hypothetical protein